jgi:hypothetical protein
LLASLLKVVFWQKKNAFLKFCAKKYSLILKLRLLRPTNLSMLTQLGLNLASMLKCQPMFDHSLSGITSSFSWVSTAK